MTDWTDTGAEEVAPGVHRVPLPMPNDGLRAVNVYLLAAADGWVLVDSGWALDLARDALVGALRGVGAELGDIRSFLVTHVHRDHYSQAVTLRREFGVPVSLGTGERASLDVLTAPGHRALGVQLAMLRECGAGELADRLSEMLGHDDVDTSEWEMPDDWLRDGQLIEVGQRSLEVVETPGHTAGHVVFRDAAGGLLFAGDHVLPTITPSIGLEPAAAANPLRDFLGSLAAVRRLPDARLLPAHGPVTKSVHARVDELIAHHGRRLDQSVAAVSGGQTAADVALVLRWTRRERRLEELDAFNQMLAVGETAAHLTLLVSQGRLTSSVVDGLRRYQPC